MRRVVLAVMAGMVLFSGCVGAKDGLAVNTMGKNKIDRYFKEGTIIGQKKAVIDDRELAVLTGLGAGALGGAAIGGMNSNAVQGGLVGAVLGGLAGGIMGNEVIAFETTIQTKDEKVVGFLKEKLPLGTVVEYTIKDGKLKNVEVIALSQAEFKIIK